MDDKELIKKIKNSFKAKKSRTEILSDFQKCGYKLAYTDKLITKAKRPKQIAIVFLITFIIFFIIIFLSSVILSNQQKIQNPLLGFTIIENTTASSLQDKKLTYDQIEISTDFISFLLQTTKTTEYLHSNLLENPIINFRIEDETFYSEIGAEIKTHEGLSENADLQFNIDKQDLIDVILSDNHEQIFRQSVISGNTQIEIKTGKIELGSKGYLKLYETLNFPSPL